MTPDADRPLRPHAAGFSRSRRRSWPLIGVLALALSLAPAPLDAAGGAPAPEARLPLAAGDEGLRLAPLPLGAEVHLGGTALRAHAEIVPTETNFDAGPADDGSPAPREGEVELRLAADIRPLLGDERESRDGTYVPHLSPAFLLRDRASGATRRVSLGFELSAHGAHYEGRAIVDGGAGPFELRLDPGEGLSAAAGLPRPVWRFAPAELPLAEPDEKDTGLDVTPATLRMNLLSSFDPRPADSYSDVWGYEDGAGGYFAIIGSTTGTTFVEVTDPANPVDVGFIGGPSSSWRDMKTYQNYAYIVTEGGGGMQIVDLADPRNPTLVNTWSNTFSPAHNIYIDTDEGTAWVVGSNNGTRILDLSQNPVNPTEVGSWTVRYVHDAYAKNGLAYFSEINNGLHEILDATNKSNLQVLSSWSTPRNAAHNSWANDAQDLVVVTDEVSSGGGSTFYDISDLQNVRQLGPYAPSPVTSAHNAFFDDVDDELVYISHYAIGLHLVDAHRPSVPVLLGYHDTYPNGDSGYNGDWGAYPFDSRGHVYASDRSYGLYVLDYAPTGGTLSGVVTNGGSGGPVQGATVTHLQSSTSFVTGADGVYAFHVDAGPVKLRVSRFGYVTRIDSAAAMTSGGRVDVDVPLAALPVQRLDGTVTRSDTSAPVAGARVSIEGMGFETTSDAAGQYVFTEVPLGQRLLRVERFGFDPLSRRVLLTTGADLTADIALDPALFADDAESDIGWQQGIPSDTATTGWWALGDPNGTGGGSVQPEVDHTAAPGVQAFHTGPSPPGRGIEWNDVDNGFTTLVSPSFDANGVGEAQVSYWRWLSRDAGPQPGGSLLVEASSNDGASWTTVELVDFEANSWNEHRADLRGLLPLTAQMRLRFRADPGPSATFDSVTEAAVDDVQISRACDALAFPASADADADGRTDGCDPCPLDALDDADGDGLCGDADNAPFHSNPGQQDGDGDGAGDAGDNCPATFHLDQRDLDGDGLGNACDGDVDGDGSLNAADPDDDDDGVADGADNCPWTVNAAQLDRDTDGQGDACDLDDGLVTGVRVDGERITWEVEQGSDGYNVYRADLGAAELVPLAGCLAPGLTAPFAVDPVIPEIANGLLYLVTRTASGSEGPLGEDSAGVPRVITGACP